MDIKYVNAKNSASTAANQAGLARNSASSDYERQIALAIEQLSNSVATLIEAQGNEAADRK